MKKILAILLSAALIFSSLSVYAASATDGDSDGDIVENPWGELFTSTAPPTTTEAPTTSEPTEVEPTVDYASMLTTDVNLAYGAAAIESSHKEGNVTQLTDGIANMWSNYSGINAVAGGTSYFDIPLGQTYSAASMDAVVVWFRTGEANFYPNSGYKIQFSDGNAYTTVATITAEDYPAVKNTTWEDGAQMMVAAVIDKDAVAGNVSTVRILIEGAVGYGAQVAEIAVFSADPQEPVEIGEATDPAGVTVSSEPSSSTKGSIDVTITAGENQEGYTYVVYLDDSDNTSLTECLAGQKYTITGVESGTHTVRVASYFGGAYSDGIVSDEVVVKTIVDDVTNEARNFALNAAWELLPNPESTIPSGSAEGDGDITNGIISGQDYVCPIKGTDGAYYIVDLGKEVDASLIESVYVWYRVMEPGCAPNAQNSQVINFSTDKETWTEAATVAGSDVIAAREAQGAAPYAVAADIETTGNVRYIQIYYPLGVAYGAQVTEIAVFGDTGVEPEEPETTEAPSDDDDETTTPEESSDEPVVEAPAAPEGLQHSPAADGSLPHYFAWAAVDGAESYNIYVNGELVAASVNAGYDLAAYVSEAGEYTIEVTAVAAGLESEKATVTYTVEGEELEDPETSTPEESSSDEPVAPEMTYEDCVVNGDGDETRHPVGNYKYYVGAWNGSTAQMAVDPEDADHIKVKQLSSLWYDAWGLQVEMKKYGLTPGETYTISVDMTSNSTDGKVKTSASNDEIPIIVGTKTLERTMEAGADGSVDITVGLGWVGLNVEVDFSNVVVKDAEGNVVDVLDAPLPVEPETSTPEESSSDEPETSTPEESSSDDTTTEEPSTETPSTEAPTTVAPETTTLTAEQEAALMKKPGKVTIKKAKKKAKKLSLKLKKVPGATAYEVAVYKSKKLAKKNNTEKAIVYKDVTKIKSVLKSKKIKKAKKLFVRVRAFVDVRGIKVTGKWSKVKKVK